MEIILAIYSKFPSLKRVLFEFALLKESRLLTKPKSLWHYLHSGRIGDRIRLEASSVCQLKCPACPTGLGKNKEGVVSSGFLKLSRFKEFVDKHHEHISEIELSNWGEILLNPDLGKIVQHAYESKIKVTISNGVNMNFVRDDILESLVKYKVEQILVSIDGATNETYQKYRIGGSLDNVLKNVEMLNQLKEKYQSSVPRLTWQFVIFKHNVHEIPQAREMAQKLNMRFQPKPQWGSGTEALTKEEQQYAKEETGLDIQKNQRPWCFQLWTQPQINWDGKLLGCCVNHWSDFGNVFESGLEKTTTSEKYEYMKDMLLGLKPPRDDISCLKCPIYKNRIFQDYVEKMLTGEEKSALANYGKFGGK